MEIKDWASMFDFHVSLDKALQKLSQERQELIELVQKLKKELEDAKQQLSTFNQKGTGVGKSSQGEGSGIGKDGGLPQ